MARSFLITLLQSQILETKRWRADTINSALDKVISGYCLKSNLTKAEVDYIFKNIPGAAIIKIESAGLHGGRHYSIHDLIGHSVGGMVFVVTNMTQFTEFMSLELERDFRDTNPEPESRVRASFTSFMHENKLHWSECCKSKNP